MIKYQENGLVANEYGACFPERPYFPLLAANGTDGILLGLTGASDEVGNIPYSTQLPFHCNIGWYKTARKDYDYNDRAYGTAPCLANLPTVPVIGKEKTSLRATEQFFCPENRVLTTVFTMFESRGTAPAKVKVASFMTDEHLLVEHYEILQAPENGIRFEFKLGPAVQNTLYDICVRPEQVEFNKLTGAGTGFKYAYHYKSPEIHDGAAAVWSDNDGSEYLPPVKPVYDRKNYSLHTIITPVIPENSSVTRYTAVVDSNDVTDFHQEIERLAAKTRAAGYNEIFREHVAARKKYFGAATVKLPEPDLEYLYNFSRYLLDATFEQKSGFMPMGIMPMNWHNAMFWDSWFASMAWLGNNNRDYSARISLFFLGKLEEAKELARKLGKSGARFGWTTGREHFDLRQESIVQFHNNAVIAIQCLQVYQANGDLDFLRKIIDVPEQSLLFLCEALIRFDDDRAYLAECSGIDESTHDLKVTDTWTTATFIKASKMYMEACRDLGRKPFRNDLEAICGMLNDALNRNVDEQGVLQSFEGGRIPHWGSLVFNLFPNHPAIRKTVEAMSRYDRELDSWNSHGVMTYLERLFTWTEFWIARILGEQEDAEGWTRLKKCAKFTGCFGSIPERIFYRGEPVKHYFMTSHSCFVWAIHSLLLSRKGKRLAVLTNLPETWKDAAFRNLTTPDGLQVSAKMRNGIIEELEIVNRHRQSREISLVVPGRNVSTEISLEHGKAYTIKR